jgi:hypothetical protein
MMLGTSNIVNPAGTCSGINKRRRVHKSWLDELWSLDKVSVTLLQSPGNHCEYKQVSDSMIRGAIFLATTTQMEGSDGCIESEKFDIFSHHASDCDSRQIRIQLYITSGYLDAIVQCTRQLGSHTPALTIPSGYSSDLRPPVVIPGTPGDSL